MFKKQGSRIITIIIIVVLLIISYFIYKHFKKVSNQIITDVTVPVKQNTKVIKVNDSTKGIFQDILITNDKAVIKNLQDSVLSLLTKNAKLTSTLNISFEEKYKESNATGHLRDSLSIEFNKLLATYKSGLLSMEEFEKIKNDVFNKKIPYTINSQYRKQNGLIDYYGNIINDTLEVTSEPLVSFGTSNKFLERPKYSVVIGNKNPLITTSSAKSIVYIPPVKTEVSFGPQILSNGKSISAGIGINIKRGIFSLSLGYSLINSKL